MTIYEIITLIGLFLGPIIAVLTAVYLVRAERAKEIRRESKRISLVKNSLLIASKNLKSVIESQLKAFDIYINQILENEANIYRFPLVVALKPNRFREFSQTDLFDILTKLEERTDENTKDIYNKFMNSIDTTEFTYNQLSQLREQTINKHNTNLLAINAINNEMFNICSTELSLNRQKGIPDNKIDKSILLYQNQLKTKSKDDETDFDYYENNFVKPFVSQKETLLKSEVGLKLFFQAVKGKNLVDDESFLVDSTISLIKHCCEDLKNTVLILEKTIMKLED